MTNIINNGQRKKTKYQKNKLSYCTFGNRIIFLNEKNEKVFFLNLIKKDVFQKQTLEETKALSEIRCVIKDFPNVKTIVFDSFQAIKPNVFSGKEIDFSKYTFLLDELTKIDNRKISTVETFLKNNLNLYLADFLSKSPDVVFADLSNIDQRIFENLIEKIIQLKKSPIFIILVNSDCDFLQEKTKSPSLNLFGFPILVKSKPEEIPSVTDISISLNKKNVESNKTNSPTSTSFLQTKSTLYDYFFILLFTSFSFTIAFWLGNNIGKQSSIVFLLYLILIIWVVIDITSILRVISHFQKLNFGFRKTQVFSIYATINIFSILLSIVFVTLLYFFNQLSGFNRLAPVFAIVLLLVINTGIFYGILEWRGKQNTDKKYISQTLYLDAKIKSKGGSNL